MVCIESCDCVRISAPRPARPRPAPRIAPMAPLDLLMEEIVTANRILAHEGVVDGFGHVSARHPQRPERYVMSRARAPQCIEVEDLMEFALDGTPVDAQGRKPYLERFIHGAIYEARPEIMSVVHNHSPSTIPFGITPNKLRPLMHLVADGRAHVHQRPQLVGR